MAAKMASIMLKMNAPGIFCDEKNKSRNLLQTQWHSKTQLSTAVTGDRAQNIRQKAERVNSQLRPMLEDTRYSRLL